MSVTRLTPILVIALVFPMACATTSSQKLAEISLGMNKDEVRVGLGEPRPEHRPLGTMIRADAGKFHAVGSLWQFGRREFAGADY